MGADSFPALQSCVGVVGVQTVQRKACACPFVEDDKELKVFNHIDLSDIEKVNDLDGFSEFIVTKVGKVDTFVGTVYHSITVIYHQLLLAARL
jgi:hypothetical protein